MMKKQQMAYRIISLLMLMAILPSVLGVHIFHHHCDACKENETIAQMFTPWHSHEHDCTDCTCHSYRPSDQDVVAHNTHEHANDCERDFKRASFDGQIADLKIKFQADAILLLHNSYYQAKPWDIEYKPQRDFCNVILKIPDEPSPEKNCVFIL